MTFHWNSSPGRQSPFIKKGCVKYLTYFLQSKQNINSITVSNWISQGQIDTRWDLPDKNIKDGMDIHEMNNDYYILPTSLVPAP